MIAIRNYSAKQVLSGIANGSPVPGTGKPSSTPAKPTQVGCKTRSVTQLFGF